MPRSGSSRWRRTHARHARGGRAGFPEALARQTAGAVPATGLSSAIHEVAPRHERAPKRRAELLLPDTRRSNLYVSEQCLPSTATTSTFKNDDGLAARGCDHLLESTKGGKPDEHDRRPCWRSGTSVLPQQRVFRSPQPRKPCSTRTGSPRRSATYRLGFADQPTHIGAPIAAPDTFRWLWSHVSMAYENISAHIEAITPPSSKDGTRSASISCAVSLWTLRFSPTVRGCCLCTLVAHR